MRVSRRGDPGPGARGHLLRACSCRQIRGGGWWYRRGPLRDRKREDREPRGHLLRACSRDPDGGRDQNPVAVPQNVPHMRDEVGIEVRKDPPLPVIVDVEPRKQLFAVAVLQQSKQLSAHTVIAAPSYFLVSLGLPYRVNSPPLLSGAAWLANQK